MWVEPQCGYVQVPSQSVAMYMHPLQYHQLPDAVSTVMISIKILVVCARARAESLMNNSYLISIPLMFFRT